MNTTVVSENTRPSLGRSSTAVLTLTALGIVYGDIGTSPLYAFQTAFSGAHALALNQANVLATLSALFWAVMLIISLKYVWFVLKFNNDGEGGVLALTALAHRMTARHPRAKQLGGAVLILGVFGSALFYGDAIITPAISVLSAVEGVGVVTPHLEKLVIPITLAILVTLFAVQRFGTARVGASFGPITCLWFITLAVLGGLSIVETPIVLQALNPMYAISFAIEHPAKMFLLLSAVFLALTGGEALYADMGHFGPRAVRIAWCGLVCPSLMINYFGQGALVLRDATAIKSSFYLLAPDGFLVPLVILATAATVIASQATISGAFSLTQQASRLGFLPRLVVRHTSDRERGQIYVPSVNWLMLAGVVILVLEFRSSTALAAAYGIAVSGTMIVTSILAGVVIYAVPRKSKALLLAAFGLFMLQEIAFFSSNLLKIGDGGWFPLALGALIFLALTTWKKGSSLLSHQRAKMNLLREGVSEALLRDVPRVEGTAVYLSSDSNTVPSALLHNMKHYRVLHSHNLVVRVVTEETPYVAAAGRVRIDRSEPALPVATLHFGFRETPDIPAALGDGSALGIPLDPMSTTYFVTRSVLQDAPGGLIGWRFALFSWMSRQSEGPASYFNLPANRVVELGTQVLL